MSFVKRGTAVIFCLALALAGASPALGEEEGEKKYYVPDQPLTTEQCKVEWGKSSAKDTCELTYIGVWLNYCSISAKCKMGNPEEGYFDAYRMNDISLEVEDVKNLRNRDGNLYVHDDSK